MVRELIEIHTSIDDFEVVASWASAIETQSVLQNETIDLLFLDSVKPKIELPST